MENKIKPIAGSLGVAMFFIIAIVAWISDCEPGTCAYRALVGGIVAYIVVSIAGRIILRILVDEIIENQVRQYSQRYTEDR
ncbi:MAG: hypothetical protein JXA82_03975 [Sedimentisphaerales bacterium]|nr:hypothetical protein [Sedimentisphaerales bacterium]